MYRQLNVSIESSILSNFIGLCIYSLCFSLFNNNNGIYLITIINDVKWNATLTISKTSLALLLIIFSDNFIGAVVNHINFHHIGIGHLGNLVSNAINFFGMCLTTQDSLCCNNFWIHFTRTEIKLTGKSLCKNWAT